MLKYKIPQVVTLPPQKKQRVTGSRKEKRRKLKNFLRFSTSNRAVLEPILADLDRLWEMRHWIPEPGKPIIPCKQTA